MCQICRYIIPFCGDFLYFRCGIKFILRICGEIVKEDMGMTNVLIISQFFAPRNVIAAVRFTKIVKYLSQTGKYRFWVICFDSKECRRDEMLQRDIDKAAEYVSIVPVEVDKTLLSMVKRLKLGKNKEFVATDNTLKGRDETNNIYYVLQEKFVNCGQKGIKGVLKRFLGRFLLGVNDVYDLGFECLFTIKAQKVLKQIPLEQMDVMISSYGDLGALMLALRIKRSCPRLGWIVDYRDPITAESYLKKKVSDLVAYKADRMADYITGATRSCVGSGRQMRRFHVIPNGYDLEDIASVSSGQNEKLTICYTGSLYYAKCNMGPLFKMIYELDDEKQLEKERIKVIYAGEQSQLLIKQARQYGMEALLDIRGNVSRGEALQIQQQSDILCALTWNNIGNDNILTGKVLEYFMMHKPILALVSGNKPGSMIKSIINKANLGYCLEEVEAEKYYDKAKTWFLNKYMEFVSTGQVVCNPEEKILEQYNCKNTAAKFGKLIEQC